MHVSSEAVAERLLGPTGPIYRSANGLRVLIGSPYRRSAARKPAHQGRALDTRSSRNSHTFQGSEAPVGHLHIVLNRTARPAVDPRRNEDNLRLLNVALTRARRRLIVLGDFNWVEQHANATRSLREMVRTSCAWLTSAA